MNFTNELIEKARSASSAEELLDMAKKEGVELTAADAETYFSFLHNNGPLSDEELDQVAGGKGEKKPRYAVGQRVVYYPQKNVPCYGYISSIKYSNYQKAWYYLCVFENGMRDEEPLEAPHCGVKVVS